MGTRAIEATLAECEAEIAQFRHQRAHDTLQELIENGSEEDLRRARASLEAVIAQFHKRRRRELTDALGRRLDGAPPKATVNLSPQASIEYQREARDRFRASVTEQLKRLSDLYIFQWGTYYRSTIERTIRETLSLIEETKGHAQPFDVIRDCFAEHTSEIFAKGYQHLQSLWSTAESSKAKALAGLRSFLALPIEIYADQSSLLTTAGDCRILRRITSKIITGILVGFSRSALGKLNPTDMLAQTVRSWTFALCLCCFDDLEWLNEFIDVESLSPLLGKPLRTLAAAVDTASEQSGVDPVVILSATINLAERAIDVALRAPSDSSDRRPLEVSVLSGPLTLVRPQAILRSKRGFIACLTPYPPSSWDDSLAGGIETRKILIQLPTDEPRAPTFLLDRLRFRFYESAIAPQVGVVLRTNIAERFPLENPTILAYFRVQRPSIRALDQILSTRTGVMLWCSVRRSGKTTGVTELSDAAEHSSIILQRCEFSSPDQTTRVLFEAIQAAVTRGTALPADFLRRCVAEAAPMSVSNERRRVLIIDEYDRLFGSLRAHGRRNADLRNLVIQPLLDQFVEFGTNNLVVLLGQQPNAHYIFMDQNQLSAYVQQQPYPLFAHTMGAGIGEFWDLLTKVFQKTLRFDVSFADALYRETAGHPFLTVNVLRDLIDWLIGQHVVAGSVRLAEADFAEFAEERLGPRAIASSGHYEYFRAATSEALSDDGRAESPWLHGVYWLLRALVMEGGVSMTLRRATVESMLARIIDSSALAMYSVDSFIASARDSNFILVERDCIQPRIRILARIAATLSPSLQ